MGFRSDPIPESPPVVGEVPSRRAAPPFSTSLTDNDSLADLGSAMVFIRRPDGLMVPITIDFPYNEKMHYVGLNDEVPFTNSWTNHIPNANRRGAYTRDFLGCTWVQGMLRSGTLSVPIFNLPELYRYTGGGQMWVTMANNAFSRIQHRSNGDLEQENGSTAWAGCTRVPAS